jgi:hypothetical protein
VTTPSCSLMPLAGSARSSTGWSTASRPRSWASASTLRPTRSPGWWHLTRIQDDHVAGVAGVEQVWTSQGWEGRFGLPFDPRDTGYGHRVRGIIQRS